MSVFEYSFFLLVGFIPIYNLVCIILNNNQQDFDKLNIKINMLIYTNEQLKTKIENIITKTKIDTTSPDVVEETHPGVEEKHLVVEESHLEEVSPLVEETHNDTLSTVVEESPLSDKDDSDIDFVQDRVRNDKASQNLSYFISSKLTNMSSNFF